MLVADQNTNGMGITPYYQQDYLRIIKKEPSLIQDVNFL